MGDVALTVPVLAGFAKQYPQDEIILLTKKAFFPFFSSVNGLKLFNADFSLRHRGIAGIRKLYKEIIKDHDPDIVIDLHDVLRSKLLCFFFRMSGLPVFTINKGRREKRMVITGKRKVFLKHTVTRYAEVFSKAGFPVDPVQGPFFKPSAQAEVEAEKLVPGNKIVIGVAPFAKHPLKMWPEEYMTQLLTMISEKNECFFIFFGGKDESDRIKAMQSKVKASINIAGKYDLDTELAVMKRLNLMIAMDSSNMHMAALAGIKVISIWGGTDPMTGFGPWMQPDSHAIRIPVEELDCRPCTVYGKGVSRRNFECMKKLTPDIVYSRIVKPGII